MAVLLISTLTGCHSFQQTSLPDEQSSPDRWPKEELDHYLALQNGGNFDASTRKRMEPQRSATSSRAMIAGTSEPFAVHAGLAVLKQGGNAVDAALTTSLAQIALTAGAAVSYAGIMTAVYFDAASGKTYTLDADYNTVQNEKEPLTIPPMGERSGRTALVPGFMAGVQALHDRFGNRPFATLFDPAIWVAEKGFPITPVVGEWLQSQKDVITRLPETRRVLTKETGQLYRAGEVFRQLELAATLKQVAKQGASYMYKGAWAQHFADLVQREGGKMTLNDMTAYHPTLREQTGMPYRDYQVIALGAPNGGAISLLGLKLAEAADLARYGHYSRSPEALYYLIQITRVSKLFAFLPAEELKRYFPDVDPSAESRVKKETAEKLWAHIRHPDWPDTVREIFGGAPRPSHSAGVVVVDERGNVASILHTINTNLWGTTGIFVDGISIPDSAAFQQSMIARVGPGVRLPDTANPLLVLRNGKPVLASSAVGSGLHEVTIENVINVLDFHMDPKTSVDQPNTQGVFLGKASNKTGKPEYEKEAIAEGAFPRSLLDAVSAKGQAVKIVSEYDQPGYWVGIQIDPANRKLTGGATSLLPALVEGY